MLTAGAGGQGQLGRVGHRMGTRHVSRTLLTPSAVRLPRGAGKPVAVFAGGWHTFAVTDTDNVVGWGLNNWGQLGVPVTGEPLFVPTVIKSLSGRGITQLACGDHHTIALTSEGSVLSFGRVSYGRLGRPADVPLEFGDGLSDAPAAVAFPTGNAKIVSVAAGMKESAAVDNRGRVFLWGNGGGNMQGRGDDEDDVLTPELIPEKEVYEFWRPGEQRILSVSIGAQHVCVLASPGHNY